MIARLAAVLAAIVPASAWAQAYQCAPPSQIGPIAPVVPDGRPRRVPVSGYTLAASWSPEYCRRPQDKGTMQCSGAHGRFGFVLHGLWPESASGSPPQWCSPKPRPSADLIRRNLCMTPVPWLLAHEWAKHGSCIARTPQAYFSAAAALWRSLRWPDADRLSRQEGLTAGDLRRAFVARNPDWKVDQVGLLVSDRGWLREVHLCYDRRFLPVTCDRRSFGPADAASLRIWRGL